MMNSKIQKAEDGKNAGSAKKSVQTAVFENPEFGTVRIVTDEKGEPWFCAKDLCDVLGYKRATDAVRQHVSPHCSHPSCNSLISNIQIF